MSIPFSIGTLGYSRVSYKRSQGYREILTSIAQNDLRYLNPVFFAFRREQRKLIDAFREKDMYKNCAKETEEK